MFRIMSSPTSSSLSSRASRKRRSSPSSYTYHRYPSPSNSTRNEKENLIDRWFAINSSDEGNERIGPLRFVPIRKGDKVLVIPCPRKRNCSHQKDCYCLRFDNYVRIETVFGYKGHIKMRFLDKTKGPLPMFCPECPIGDFGQRFTKQTNLLEHLKKYHGGEKIREFVRSTPPYKCPLYHLCGFSSSVSVNQVINHYFDPACHGTETLQRLVLSTFVSKAHHGAKEKKMENSSNSTKKDCQKCVNDAKVTTTQIDVSGCKFLILYINF